VFWEWGQWISQRLISLVSLTATKLQKGEWGSLGAKGIICDRQHLDSFFIGAHASPARSGLSRHSSHHPRTNTTPQSLKRVSSTYILKVATRIRAFSQCNKVKPGLIYCFVQQYVGSLLSVPALTLRPGYTYTMNSNPEKVQPWKAFMAAPTISPHDVSLETSTHPSGSLRVEGIQSKHETGFGKGCPFV